MTKEVRVKEVGHVQVNLLIFDHLKRLLSLKGPLLIEQIDVRNEFFIAFFVL